MGKRISHDSGAGLGLGCVAGGSRGHGLDGGAGGILSRSAGGAGTVSSSRSRGEMGDREVLPDGR